MYTIGDNAQQSSQSVDLATGACNLANGACRMALRWPDLRNLEAPCGKGTDTTGNVQGHCLQALLACRWPCRGVLVKCTA